jgi:hypothetical protein
LHQRLLRELRAFLGLLRIEQNELLNLLQLFEELFHGKIAPSGFGLAMQSPKSATQESPLLTETYIAPSGFAAGHHR